MTFIDQGTQVVLRTDSISTINAVLSEMKSQLFQKEIIVMFTKSCLISFCLIKYYSIWSWRSSTAMEVLDMNRITSMIVKDHFKIWFHFFVIADFSSVVRYWVVLKTSSTISRRMFWIFNEDLYLCSQFRTVQVDCLEIVETEGTNSICITNVFLLIGRKVH